MPAAAIIGAGVLGAGTTLIAGGKAAKAQKQAADMQVAESRRQYDQDRADLAPWRQVGQGALSRLAKEYGLTLDPQLEAQGGSASGFTASPGYDFRLSEGIKATERSAASRGLLKSGASLKAIQRYGEGLAADEYGSYWNRLAGLAGVGQSATNATVAAGQSASGGISQAYRDMGSARASAYANTGSAINSGINNVLSAYLFTRGGNMFSGGGASGGW